MSELSNILKKADGFDKNPSIATAKSFIELSDLLNGVIKAIEASKTEPISISNPEAIKPEPIDLNPLKEAINAVIPTIKDIKATDLSGVVKLLEKISNKEDKEVDLKELNNISEILKAVNDSINAIIIPPQVDHVQQIVPDLKNIQEILKTLNENLVAIEIPEFDYEKLERIIKKIKIVGGGGPSTVTTTPASGSLQDVNITKVGGTTIGNTVPISTPGTVSTANSTTTPLAGGGIFTGTFEDVSAYASIGVLLNTDQNSAASGVEIDYSDDGITVRKQSITTLVALASATDGYFFSLIPQAKYYRLKYTNGATPQTRFIVQTILSSTADGLTQIPIASGLQDTDSAALTMSVGKNRSGTNTYATNRGDTTGNQGIYPKSGSGVLSDNRSNTQTVSVDESGIALANTPFPFIFNNSTWDKQRSVINATNSIGTGIIAAGIIGQFDDVSPQTVTENQFGNIRMSSKGVLYNQIRDAAGNERGANVNANNELTVAANIAPSATSTGLTVYNSTALSNVKQTVKASAGNLYGYHIFNPGTATVYVQIFNKLAASVTVGTTVPDWVYAIPATTSSPAGLDGMFAIPIAFNTGMVIAATTTSTGSTVPGTALLANFFYI